MPSPTEDTFPRPVWQLTVHPKMIGLRLPVPMDKIPGLGIFRWHDRDDGTFEPRVELHDAWIRLGEVESLPLGGLTVEVTRKLIDGGFIFACAPAPSLTLVNISDLLRHREETSEDPQWWTPEKLRRYKEGDEPREWPLERRVTLPAEKGKVRAIGIYEIIATRAAGQIQLSAECRVKESWMRISEVERMPLGISAEVMFRLIRSSFVLGTVAAPASTFIDVWDLLRHYEQTSGPNAAEFWTSERRKRYAEAGSMRSDEG